MKWQTFCLSLNVLNESQWIDKDDRVSTMRVVPAMVTRQHTPFSICAHCVASIYLEWEPELSLAQGTPEEDPEDPGSRCLLYFVGGSSAGPTRFALANPGLLRDSCWAGDLVGGPRTPWVGPRTLWAGDFVGGPRTLWEGDLAGGTGALRGKAMGFTKVGCGVLEKLWHAVSGSVLSAWWCAGPGVVEVDDVLSGWLCTVPGVEDADDILSACRCGGPGVEKAAVLSSAWWSTGPGVEKTDVLCRDPGVEEADKVLTPLMWFTGPGVEEADKVLTPLMWFTGPGVAEAEAELLSTDPPEFGCIPGLVWSMIGIWPLGEFWAESTIIGKP